jgi:hypothetical protein
MLEHCESLTPFRVLRRVFLSRLMDFELLASEGDTSKLVGQFVTLLASVSLAITLPLLLISGLPQEDIWGMQHFLIATTMMVAGIFAMVSWESILPERKDLMILGPLPITRSTLFFAKISALANALLLAIVALNAFTGLGWVILFEPTGGGFLGLLRSFAAYWTTVLAAGSFVFFGVVLVHGAASLLPPRQWFLRASAWLQMAGLILVLADYVLEPSLESLPALTDPRNQSLLHTLPSYWFLGLFQGLNGTMLPAFSTLARLSLTGLAIAGTGALTALLIAFVRAMPKIIDEPEIQPTRTACARLLPQGGDPLRRAVLVFSMRTLLRSRQHRLMLGFFLSVGLIVMALYMHAPTVLQESGHKVNSVTVPFLIGTLIMMCVSVLGARIVISVPVLLKANWIFQLTQASPSQLYWRASRRALLTIAVVPVWIASALVCLWVGGGWEGIVHLVVLALFGAILVDFAMIKLHKVPFACSWMPGKANLLVLFFGGIIVGLPLANEAGLLEMRLLERPATWPLLIAGLCLIAAATRWKIGASAVTHQDLVFEEKEKPILLALKLD